MDAGVNILCYKSKTLANGAHPLMIRVCKDGKKKYVSLGVSVLPQFWDFTKNQPKKNCPNKAYIEKIIADKSSEFAERIIELKAEKNCNENELQELAKTALKQINDKKYDTELKSKGVKMIYKYGVAFSGKHVAVEAE